MSKPINERPFWNFFDMLGNIFLLNTFWVIGCIPIFTIGTSTTALYYVFLKILRGEKGPLLTLFTKSFRENFKQATFVWIIYLFLAIDAGFVWWTFHSSQSTPGSLWLYIAGLAGIFYISTLLYVFPVLALFKSSTLQCFIDAFVLSGKHIFTNMFMVVTSFIILFAIYCFPPLFLIGFGLIAYLNSILLCRIFNKHILESKNNQDDSDVLDTEIVYSDPS